MAEVFEKGIEIHFVMNAFLGFQDLHIFHDVPIIHQLLFILKIIFFFPCTDHYFSKYGC